MSTPAVALAGHPHNPARGASEVRVQWTKPHLCANLYTKPAPRLAVVARKLYVVWDPDNLTELQLYGPHLSYEIKASSKGNGTLTYITQPDQPGEWIPIVQHIHNTAPGLKTVGVGHTADFTTLNKRAEEEAQKVARFPWSAHHTDGRIVPLWQGGGEGALRPRARAAQRQART